MIRGGTKQGWLDLPALVRFRSARGVYSRRPLARPAVSAFTLVELLLVLTLLAVVIGIAMPTLGKFFRGRTLESEARRLLTLTRSGQSRAIYEGVPMYLWIDASRRAYGIEQEPGWNERDPRASEFTLGTELTIEVVKTNPPASLRPNPVVEPSALVRSEKQNLPGIRFMPDGTIGEDSLPAVRLTDKDGSSLWLAQTEYRLGYEIRNDFEK